uniref:DUF4283 domain-containing protein n=1 Tax=Cannabis sativa TaxID=3483 RepID=A0A803QI18_CANSA
MAKRAKMAGKGKSKGKRTGPSSSDRVIKTRSMDAVLGIQELAIEEDVDSMERCRDDELYAERCLSPADSESNIVRNLENSYELPDIEVVSTGLKKKIKIDFEDIAEEVNYWQPSLVCYVIGANPPISEGFVRRLWKEEVVKVGLLAKGIFIIRFQSMEQRDKVMQQGYVFFDRKPMVMKPWNPIDDFTKEEVTNVPTWIQLKGLDFKYWGESSLLKIRMKGQSRLTQEGREIPQPQMDRFLCWNVRGINGQQKHDEIKQLIFSKGAGFQQVGKFFVSLVYAFNDVKKREELWDELEEVAHKIDEPWLIMGDFNEILKANERIGKRAQSLPSQRFRDSMEKCKMADLKFSGSFFTWNNKQTPEERIFSKIDRAMVNTQWLNVFPCSEAVFLPEMNFDHSPILVTIYEDKSYGKKPFRYYNMWKMAPEYDKLVAKSCEEESRGSKMFRIVHKLRRFKTVLKQINRTDFSKIQKAETAARTQLAEIQGDLNQNPGNEDLMMQEQMVREKYAEISKAYASFMTQKAKINWAKFGDDNSHLFHASLKLRRIQNKIFSTKDEYGNWCDSPDKVQSAFLEYYQRLLGSKIPVRRKVFQSIVDLGPKINDCHREILLAEYTAKEVESAMFSIDKDKAPGPDGYRRMEYLSRIFTKVGTSTGFKFHDRCASIKLNHMCFADDLLVFYHGDYISVLLLLQGLKLFSASSGPQTNEQKTTIYCAGMQELEITRIIEASNFKRSTLPFTYLGPGLVAWDSVCRPKAAGGLGFRNVQHWNMAALGSWAWRKIVALKNKLQQQVSLTSFVMQKYKIQQGYHLLFAEYDKLPWSNLVWDRLVVPNHRFILCKEEETIVHLFFECD